jgi:hypothetical protein
MQWICECKYASNQTIPAIRRKSTRGKQAREKNRKRNRAKEEEKRLPQKNTTGRPPGHLTNGSGLQISDSRMNIFAQRRVGNLTVKDSYRESCNRPVTTNEYQHTHQSLSRMNQRQRLQTSRSCSRKYQ